MTDKEVRLLEAMSATGANRQTLAVLAEVSGLKFKDADEEHYLFGPLVVHDSAWNDTLPRWCVQQAYCERWKIVTGELIDHVVGPTEMMCVMYGATLSAPMSHDCSDLYLWASRHAIVAHYGIDSEPAKTANELCEHTEDKDVLRQGGRLYYDYHNLAHDIRHKVIKARREELKAARKLAKASTATQIEERGQRSLFRETP